MLQARKHGTNPVPALEGAKLAAPGAHADPHRRSSFLEAAQVSFIACCTAPHRYTMGISKVNVKKTLKRTVP